MSQVSSRKYKRGCGSWKDPGGSINLPFDDLFLLQGLLKRLTHQDVYFLNGGYWRDITAGTYYVLIRPFTNQDWALNLMTSGFSPYSLHMAFIYLHAEAAGDVIRDQATKNMFPLPECTVSK